MSIVSTVQLVIGGCPATLVSELAEAHLLKLNENRRRSFDWSHEPERAFAGLVLERLAAARFGGLSVFGCEAQTSLSSWDEVALEPFFADVLRARPRARLVASWETDHDDDGLANWSWRANVGEEESSTAPGDSGWVTSRVPARIHGSDYDDEMETDAPKRARIEPGRRKLLGAYVMCLDASERPTRRKKKTDSPALASVMEALAAPSRKDSPWPAWSSETIDLDVAAWLRELGSLGMELVVGLQWDGRSASVVRLSPPRKVVVLEPRQDFLWSPACVCVSDWAPANEEGATASLRARSRPARSSASKSRALGLPARRTLAALPKASMIGVNTQQFFIDLTKLPAPARRAVLEELAPLVRDETAVGSADDGIKLDMVVLGLLEFTSVVENLDDAISLLAIADQLPPGALLSQLAKALDASPPIDGLAEKLLGSPWLVGLAEGAPALDAWNDKQPNVRAAALIARVEGEPPFEVDEWGRKVRAELAAMSKAQRAAWTTFFRAVDAEPFPFRIDTGERRWERATKKLTDATARATQWLEAFVKAVPPTLSQERPEHERRNQTRNLRIVEALTHLAARNDGGAVAGLARALVDVSLGTTSNTKDLGARGTVLAPRLAYRAIDMLADRAFATTLHEVADSVPFERVAAYARGLATRVSGQAEAP